MSGAVKEYQEEAMKVVVDYDLCEANAVCMQHAPKVFRVEEDDTLTVLLEDVPAEEQESAREAERLCPRQAIRLTD
ncbi:MAG: ferredoxin [Myxococcota bacterium]|nr:ferredoxin [Myxococcota bacterium]